MKNSSTVSLAAVALFAALTAVGAFIKIPLPYVPFTLQVLFVFLAGSLLGSKRGMQSQLVYVGMGLAGVPVFTNGAGFGYVMQPTFGYLIGFIAGAFVVGFIIERIANPKIHHFIIANFAGLLVVYLFGVPYLYMALNTWMGVPSSWTHILMIGFVYSIAGDIFISLIAGVLAKRLYKEFHKNRANNKISLQKDTSCN
ncbi:biotin transporter BioY [Mesobacillus zeae]|uniref:Biotin transporter n=1 Tax=Mesobacillus zeae TaxID=1917180 RepID=A0A398AY08_9BACI|nr:biotin transporter BioY [Mesobacillus zeae]RID82455.1 biotin transporter BioY [Mesobacillus zeae]